MQQQDPFAFFQQNKNTEIIEMSKPKKKVHLDPMVQMESIMIANKFSKNKNVAEKDNQMEREEDAAQEERQGDDQGQENNISLPVQIGIEEEEARVESDNQENKNRLEPIEIQVQRSDQGCIHQVFYPKGYQRKLFTGPCTARKYPFTLDPFQQKSVRAIESNQSVLVCAHTSAGKTAIAEYAIALALRQNSRVVYTSPIKALSNQKYRQLKKDFADVGLITGDVTIDQSASCLVMTTQILRNMIYRGSEIVRQVKWVIFDQVHYMRDKERGVVWEQTIILLTGVKFVFLSATIGNPEEFACWITKLKKQPCNVVYTDYRPVPLQHYLCPAGGDGLYMVVDQNGKFYDNHFNKAVELLGETVNIIGLDQKKKNNQNIGSDLSKIIKIIMQRSMDPAIIFSFSKRDVQSFAKSVVQKYDLTTKDQKIKISQIFEDAIAVLDQIDRNLATITAIKGILLKGIGIHHGGLLPLLKETVQVLFQAGLIKILFSTQTFSMGINMPAKTVVFTSVRKFDGMTFRWIGGGEYIQMSGRAGRRGLDKKGITILMIDQKIQPQSAKAMLKGKSDQLLSSFYINYNMLLNSQRLEDIDPDFILARSFLQHQHDTKLPKMLETHSQLLATYKQSALDQQTESELQQLYLLSQKLQEEKEKLRLLTFTPKNILQYMNVGRIVRVKERDRNADRVIDWGYGYVINFHKKDKKKGKDGKEKETKEIEEVFYVVDVMVWAKKERTDRFQPESLDKDGQMVVLTFLLTCIYEITAIKVTQMPQDLTNDQSKKALKLTLSELSKKKFQQITIPSSRPDTQAISSSISHLEQQLASFSHLLPSLQLYKARRSMYQQIKQSNKKIKEFSAIVLRKEKKAYMRVLKRMGMIEKGVVTRKGNVTCGISSNHELLLTQLLFSGFFNDMNQIQIAAILSSLVHQQKSSTDRKYTKTPKLKSKLSELLVQAKSLYKILFQCKVPLEQVPFCSYSQDQYLDSIKESLIEVAYQWASGNTFAAICKNTEAYEGSVIRTFRRLNQLLKQLASVAKQIGNQELSAKFQGAGTRIFRGIVQAASLYTA